MEEITNKNIYISPQGKDALGADNLKKLASIVTTPVAFVTGKDSYKNPEKLRGELKISDEVNASNLSNKGFQDSVALGKPSATPAASSANDLCAVSIPDKPETFRDTFNRIAHVDARAGDPKLDVDLNSRDPVAIAHELGHCGQEPILKSDPAVTDKILAAEVGADQKAAKVFPEYATALADARNIGGQHDSMKGDIDHATGLFSQNKLSAADVTKTYDGLNRKIGEQYANDPRMDRERTDFALLYALDPENLSNKTPLSQQDNAIIDGAREQIGRKKAPEIIQDIPAALRSSAGIDDNFYRKTAENMPRDPRLISDLIKKIQPGDLNENEKAAADLYTTSADKVYPPTETKASNTIPNTIMVPARSLVSAP